MLTKDNVTIGIEWRFGSDWPGQRCGAKTRRGSSCQRPANKKNGRCRLHGGASNGAKTEEGRARISAANLRHEAISRFFELGLNIPEVAVISGHKDPRMLFRYTHLRAEELVGRL